MTDNGDALDGVSDRYTRSSPWPLFVALGVVLSELGVLFNALSVAVGGLVLFSASVVGILRESGYARTLWRPTAALGVLFGLVGVALFVGAAMPFRATYVGGVGALLVLGALGLVLTGSGRR
jgi:phosphatidylglycerophosphate synthase